jgi:uncharacterized protein (DUF697 family)
MSCTTTRRINATLEAAEARWGRGHCRTWTTVANTANALEDTYLDLNVIGYDFAEDLYYVWFDGGTGTDPAISGKTGIEVTVSSGDSAAAVAAAIKTAIDTADVPCFVSVSGDVVTIENQVQGAITAETDSGSTGFSLEVGTVGLSVELGGTSGPLELSMATEVVDIVSNQTGSIIGSQIQTGATAEITMSLIEITKERFDTLVGEVTGDAVTPMGGTKVTGYGESRLFTALDELGGQLILHPIRLPDSDKSADVVFFRSAPKPASLNFDGTAPQEMEVTFTAYLDRGYNTGINLFAKGDWTQKGLRA